MQHHGEAEWKRMSELERQRRLVEMKRKERQLRSEGKMDEVDILLGQYLKHKQGKFYIINQYCCKIKSEHQTRTIKILQSLCVSHKNVETCRNQLAPKFSKRKMGMMRQYKGSTDQSHLRM
jgi:hypothetical protein